MAGVVGVSYRVVGGGFGAVYVEGGLGVRVSAVEGRSSMAYLGKVRFIKGLQGEEESGRLGCYCRRNEQRAES